MKGDYTREGAEFWWEIPDTCKCQAVVGMRWGDGGYGFAQVTCGNPMPCPEHP